MANIVMDNVVMPYIHMAICLWPVLSWNGKGVPDQRQEAAYAQLAAAMFTQTRRPIASGTLARTKKSRARARMRSPGDQSLSRSVILREHIRDGEPMAFTSQARGADAPGPADQSQNGGDEAETTQPACVQLLRRHGSTHTLSPTPLRGHAEMVQPTTSFFSK